MSIAIHYKLNQRYRYLKSEKKNKITCLTQKRHFLDQRNSIASDHYDYEVSQQPNCRCQW